MRKFPRLRESRNWKRRFPRYQSKQYIASSDYYQYSSSLQPVPRPVCICFYNGTREQPERTELRLSDAYEGEGDVEVKVTQLCPLLIPCFPPSNHEERGVSRCIRSVPN